MATIAIPGNKAAPNYGLIGDSVETAVPFTVGYETSALVMPLPTADGVVTEVLLRDIPERGETLLLWMGVPLILTTGGIKLYTSVSQPPDTEVSWSPEFKPVCGVVYRLVISKAGSTEHIRFEIYDNDAGGDYIAQAHTTWASLNDSTPIAIGRLSDNWWADLSQDFEPALGMRVLEMREASGPTSLSLFPGYVKTNWAKEKRRVGQFVVGHLHEKDGFKFELVAGGGDTNNGLFTIVDDTLQTVDPLTSGPKYVRVRVTDRFGRSLTESLTLGVGMSVPTDIQLDNDWVEAGDNNTTVVGNLTTTDSDEGDAFTYTLVAGEGDADNAEFLIVGDILTFNAGTSFETVRDFTCRIRSTDNMGMFVEEAFVIRSLDTIAPSILDATVTPTPNSWTVDISGINASHDPNVGNLSFAATADVNYYPVPEDYAAELTTHEISEYMRAGADTYTIYIWVRDESGNVCQIPYSAEVEITDTIAPVFGEVILNNPEPNTYTGAPSSINATDDMSVNIYIQFTDTDVAPLAGDPGWQLYGGAMSYTIGTENGPGSYTIYAWAKDDSGNVSATSTSFEVTVTDTEGPSLLTFSVDPATSYTVSITGVGAEDNFSTMAGGGILFLVNMGGSGVPAIDDPSWFSGETISPTYTIPVENRAGSGTYNLFCWAKDADNNLCVIPWQSQVEVVIGDAPVMTVFTIPATGTEYVVFPTALAGTDTEDTVPNLYNITLTNVASAADHPNWVTEATWILVGANVAGGTPLGSGDYTIYCWAKDSDNNVSATSLSATVTLTIGDAPVMTAFTIPTTGTSYTVDITSLAATDDVAVTHYCIRVQNDPDPLPGDSDWFVYTGGALSFDIPGNAQAGSGVYGLDAWAKDGDNNVSAPMNDTITLTIA